MFDSSFLFVMWISLNLPQSWLPWYMFKIHRLKIFFYFFIAEEEEDEGEGEGEGEDEEDDA